MFLAAQEAEGCTVMLLFFAVVVVGVVVDNWGKFKYSVLWEGIIVDAGLGQCGVL